MMRRASALPLGLLLVAAAAAPARGEPAAAHEPARAPADAPLLGRLSAIDPPSPAPETGDGALLLPLRFVDVQAADGGPRPDVAPGPTLTVDLWFANTGEDGALRDLEAARRRLRRGRWYVIRVGAPFEGALPATIAASRRRGRPVCTGAEEHVRRFLAPGEAPALRRRPLDLDGDGDDGDGLALAIEARCGAREDNCAYHLYRLRGGCAEHLGETFGGPEPAPGRRHRGLRDLITLWHEGGGLRWSEARLRFDGRRYRVVATRRCVEAPAGGARCTRG